MERTGRGCRILRFEPLERRELLAADGLQQNTMEPRDVDMDGDITPQDLLLLLSAIDDPTVAQRSPELRLDVDNDSVLTGGDVLPVLRRLRRGHGQGLPGDDAPPEIRTLDGSGNNLSNPSWGAADTPLLRNTAVDYADGLGSPAGPDRPSPRVISNSLVQQSELLANAGQLSDLAWVWGQFLDHDLDLTEPAEPAEPLPIPVPTGDPFFDPRGEGDVEIPLNRSQYVVEPEGELSPRQQVNQISSFIDASMVYGSDPARAEALRTFSGGRLKTSPGNLLPFNEAGLPNAGGTDASLFLAGDVRANENAALTSMHTLWVREHNRVADRLAADLPFLADEAIFQRARAVVIAQIQAITYHEFLPALLGYDALAVYQGYDPTVHPGIANVFSTAAYRLGHSMLSPELLRLDDDQLVIAAGNLPLRNAFFAPHEVSAHGIDSLLRGAAVQVAQQIDTRIVDDVRNFLFGPPGAGGFDLASLNIQRGRDHGLADYNQVRVDYGLEAVDDFDQITSDAALAAALEELYGDVDNIDPWIGALAEDPPAGLNVGQLTRTVLVDQFTRLRDGDRLWYTNLFVGEQLRVIDDTRLADVILRNTGIDQIQENVFFGSDVMFHEASRAPATMNMTMEDDTVTLTDTGGRLIEQRVVDTMTQMVLVGSSRNDRFWLDLSQASADMQEVLFVHGGEGKADRVRIVTSNQQDSIHVRAGQVLINGITLYITGVEFLVIDTGLSDDLVTVDDGLDFQVHVIGR